MGKYLKKFETHSAYEAYISGEDAILPNVSIDGEHVHYNPLATISVVLWERIYDWDTGRWTELYDEDMNLICRWEFSAEDEARFTREDLYDGAVPEPIITIPLSDAKRVKFLKTSYGGLEIGMMSIDSNDYGRAYYGPQSVGTWGTPEYHFLGDFTDSNTWDWCHARDGSWWGDLKSGDVVGVRYYYA